MENNWAEMSSSKRQEARFQRWLAPEGVEFESAEAASRYNRRVTRVKDAIQLQKKPDRIPIYSNYTFMPAAAFGVTPKEMMEDPAACMATWKRFLTEYDMDTFNPPDAIFSSAPLRHLDYQLYRWPGHNLAAESVYQCVEKEYMGAEDYRALINDPTDFWMRTYLPRICGSLAPLSQLAPLTGMVELPAMGPYLAGFGLPDVQAALKSLMAAGEATLKWYGHFEEFDRWALQKGYVTNCGGFSKAPYDVLADTLRGSRGAIMDMYRQPEVLLEALERITPLMIQMGLAGPEETGNPLIFMPLHKGDDGFMSDEQFRTYYWPSLEKVIAAFIREGCVPVLFIEGSYNSRLEYLAELPKGSCLLTFDRTDMLKVKEVVGSTACIAGNVPAGLLLTGKPAEVKAHCKELMDTIGQEGGYMLSFGTAMDDCNTATLKAFIESVREFG